MKALIFKQWRGCRTRTRYINSHSHLITHVLPYGSNSNTTKPLYGNNHEGDNLLCGCV